MPKPHINPVSHLSSRQHDGKFLSDQMMMRQRFASAKNLYWRNLHSHFGCVNAIEFSADGKWMLSGGDDKRVLLWNMDKAIANYGSPAIMDTEHTSNIFCLGFGSSRGHIYSGGNDEHLMVHRAETGSLDNIILHHDSIYGLSIDPQNENILATACNDGTAFIYDLRRQALLCHESVLQIKATAAFHAIMHNPVQSILVTTANTREGVALWDLRKLPSPVIKFTDSVNDVHSAMSVRFNVKGTQIVALRKRHSVILYNIASQYPIAEFDDSTYYNSCTMKSCCFAGDDDQYILSGSDDFKLYMWRIPSELSDNQLKERDEPVFVEKAHMRLPGHRSIVNQVRYNYKNSMIASSGVEKIIKLWSCFPLPEGGSSSTDENTNSARNEIKRRVYSHEDYISLVLHSGQLMSHDYSHQSMKEDPRMMAFFDSLVQRDIEGWTSDSDSDVADGYTLLTASSSSDSSDTDSVENVLSSQTESYINSLVSKIESQPSIKCEESANIDHGSTPTVECVDSASSSTAIGNQVSRVNEMIASTSASSATSTCSPCPRWSRLTSSSSVKPTSTPNDSTVNNNRSNACNSRATMVQSNEENAESDKIVQLIASKKVEQLRKTARFVARFTKSRLKRVNKRFKIDEMIKTGQCSSKMSGDAASRYQRVDQLTQTLITLVKQNFPKTPEQIKRLRSKSRKKLRRLTTQSDFILNEVLPATEDSSSSDTDSDFMPHDLLANALSEADDIFAGEGDSSTSQDWVTTDDDDETFASDVESDSSDESNLITFGNPNDPSSSSSSSPTRDGRRVKKFKRQQSAPDEAVSNGQVVAGEDTFTSQTHPVNFVLTGQPADVSDLPTDQEYPVERTKNSSDQSVEDATTSLAPPSPPPTSSPSCSHS